MHSLKKKIPLNYNSKVAIMVTILVGNVNAKILLFPNSLLAKKWLNFNGSCVRKCLLS